MTELEEIRLRNYSGSCGSSEAICVIAQWEGIWSKEANLSGSLTLLRDFN